jgi:glycerophosphoryl diester phosphodiesterase
MLIIAHRCGTFTDLPENSIAAARRALEIGADVVELDIRYSRDGVPVVVHDPDFARLCGIARRVTDCTADEIAGFRYHQHPTAGPLPFAAFAAAGIRPLLIHFKLGADELACFLPVLEAAGHLASAVVGVQSREALRVARAYPGRPKTLGFIPSLAEVSGFLAEGADVIRLWDPWINAGTVEAIRAAHRQVWVMTGRPADNSVGLVEPARLAEYFDRGLDGILLNDVALGVRAARAIRERRPPA